MPPARAPECIELLPRAGETPSTRPPVRIFVGSEPAQQRAERVFVWSIERVRDPGRRYEIHLLSELPGFERRGWTTGFTNYRFAVPELAGATGRAIYNDVDQVYLEDPAALFDLELGGHGLLTVDPRDPSVALIDCAAMAHVWTAQRARSESKQRLIDRALAVPGLRGALPPEWNARDDEPASGKEKLIHYTTLHTQPWRPFPERFAYLESPVAEIWRAIERRADAAGFALRSRARPSPAFAAWAAQPHAEGDLTGCPDADLPWLLRERFAAAHERVALELDWDGGLRDAHRQWQRVADAARPFPEIAWQATLRGPRARSWQRRGGARREAPRVWVLLDDRPGNATQALGLAEALGWPSEPKRLRPTIAAGLHNRLLGASRAGADRRRSSPLAPPWPDLVIGAGRRCAPVAEWIRAQSSGHARLVMLGRKAGDDADRFDLVVTPVHTRLRPHPNRVETATPLHRATRARLDEAHAVWEPRLAGGRAPRIGVLVGGRSGQFDCDAVAARRLGEDVVRLARERGGSLLATTSRRLAPDAAEAFCRAVEGAGTVYRWSPDVPEDENPYLGILALADLLVVTGDSESMLAEACASGRPVLVYALPERASFRWLGAPREAVWRRSLAAPRSARGTPRPQGAVARLCARLIERGFVRPPRDLTRLHDALAERGLARPFGAADAAGESGAARDLDAVVARVRALFGPAAAG